MKFPLLTPGIQIFDIRCYFFFIGKEITASGNSEVCKPGRVEFDNQGLEEWSNQFHQESSDTFLTWIK
jgi:hypothetical protein